MFDRDYAARQVLGRHGRGASDEDVKLFADLGKRRDHRIDGKRVQRHQRRQHGDCLLRP